MSFSDSVLSTAFHLAPTLLTLVAGGALLLGADYVLLQRHRAGSEEARFGRQITMLVLTIILATVVLLVLPVSEATRGQLLGLLGLAVTAAITLSSATFVSNVMAGLMLRSVGNMRPGDYVRVGDHFGRVTVRGLFHTEIQTADRDLTTLPNLYLVSNPVTVVRESGTIVSCEVSLGYDNRHNEIEPLLLEAAERTGLSDSFVHVTELGNFSVGFRVAGFLAEIRTLLSTRSDLRKNVLDSLHGAGIEILSPTFMNQRPVAAEARILPVAAAEVPAAAPAAATPVAEDIAFDKAEEAERIEKKKRTLKELRDRLANLEEEMRSGDPERAESLRREMETGRAEAERMEHELADDPGEAART